MQRKRDIISNNLKTCRTSAGYTQKQVADILGFSSVVAISHWENGVNIPSLLNLFKLSTLYNVHPFDLYVDLIAEYRELVRFPCSVTGTKDL